MARIKAILTVTSILMICVSCGGQEDRIVNISIVLPTDWESVIDMGTLGAVSATPYIGTIRFLYDSALGKYVDYSYDSRSASFSAGQADAVTVQAITAGHVLMENRVSGLRSASGEVTLTLDKANGFSEAGSLLFPRQNHSAVLVSDTTFIIGGNLNTGAIEMVASPAGTYEASAYAASLTYPRGETTVLSDTAGQQLFVFKGAAAVDDNLYEIVNLGSVLVIPRMLSNPRYNYFPILNNQEIFLLGGNDSGMNWFESTLVINAQNFSEFIWTSLGTATERNNPRCINDNYKLSCFGGETNIIEVFDLNEGKVDYSLPILPDMTGFTATMLESGNIIIVGGLEGVAVQNKVKIFNPYSGELLTLGAGMNYQRYFHSATIINDTQLLIIGGGSSVDSAHTAELLNLTTGESALLPWRLKVPRVGHTATLLPDGRVLVAGGNATDRTIEVFNPRIN